MSRNPPPPETCHRTGHVMTCFEDGKKRFRTAPLAQELPNVVQELTALITPTEVESPAARRKD
jgi:hypothetical protein